MNEKMLLKIMDVKFAALLSMSKDCLGLRQVHIYKKKQHFLNLFFYFYYFIAQFRTVDRSSIESSL